MTATKPRYQIGDFFKYQDSYFEVLDLNPDNSYELIECNIFGDRVTEDKTYLSFAAKGMRKVKKKVDPVREEIKQTKTSRDNYVVPDEDEELSEDIVLVNSPSFYSAIDSLKDSTEIGFDIETYGVEKKSDASHPDTGEIRLLQAYIPSIKKTLVWDMFEDLDGLHILLEKLQDSQCQVFIHNAAFECLWMYKKFDLWITNILDTMMLSQIYYAGCLNGFNKIGVKSPNSLKELVARECRILLDKENQFYDYYLPIQNAQLNYGANDAKYCYIAGSKLLDRAVNEEGLGKVIEAEMSAINAFLMMNLGGLPISPTKTEEILYLYESKIEEIKKPWTEKFPDINLNSPQQVLEGFKSLGYTPTNKEGKLCTNNPTLTEIALTETKNTELVELIDSLLLYRSVLKDIQYLESYQKAIVVGDDGYPVMKSRYNQNAAQCTGRSSSSKPNAQNIPQITPKKKKKGLQSLRLIFTPPVDENGQPLQSMILVDFAGSHAQILRQLSQDPKLLEAHNSGIKLHFYTATGILAQMGIETTPKELAKAKKDKTNWLWSKVDVDEIYAASKTVWYGGQNLNGAVTLQASFLKKASMLKSEEICKQYISGWREYYSASYKYQRDSINESNALDRKIRVYTSFSLDQKIQIGVTGNKRYATAISPLDGGRMFVEKFPDKFAQKWGKKMQWSAKGTDLCSYRWLRPEGTIIKSAMGKIWLEFIFKPEWKARIWQMTHDEIGCLCAPEYALEVADFVNKTMAEEFKKFVPDYKPDSEDPKTCIINNWSEK